MGSSDAAGEFMVETLDKQELHFRTGFGLTRKCMKKTIEAPKYGVGQGIGWSGQACSATLNTICKAMETSCRGMKFVNPKKNIIINTFGDSFVDDTELGTNALGKGNEITLLEQAQFKDQKHSLYWFTSGGRNAVDKCLWYYVSFKFVKGKAVMKKIYKIEGELKTRPSFEDLAQLVPRFEIDKAHKTLGCWVCPSLDQSKQKNEMIKCCKKWVERVKTSFLKAHEKINCL